MKLKLTPQFIIAFLALTFVMHEAHEIIHTSVGRIICGAWGERDFNAWALCEGCNEKKSLAVLATFAGPVFTFLMIWIGAFLIHPNKTINQKTIGFSLIFANIPFARILTTSLGGGDEVFGLNTVLKNHSLAWLIGSVVVLSITIIPLVKAYILIQNNNKISWFVLFLLAPIVMDVLLVLGLMNTLLTKGILSSYWVLGSPIIVTLWTISVTSVFILTYKNIYLLHKNE